MFFFFSSRRRHTRSDRDWSSDVCSSDLRARRIPSQGTRRFPRDRESRSVARGSAECRPPSRRGCRRHTPRRRRPACPAMTRLPWITPLLEVPLLLGLAASIAMAQVKYFSYPIADSPSAARSANAAGSPTAVGSRVAESTPDYHHLLLVAYDVTKRHLSEWKEIPHVVDAYPGLSGRAVVIDVAADYPENVAAVE